MIRRPLFRRWCVLALPLMAACADRSPTLPLTPADLPPSSVALTCTVDVAPARMTCTPLQPSGSARGAKLLGGQDKYVKLTSFGTAYDGGTQILSSNVTVQNLLQENIGTTDGSTVAGVDVFFANLNVTSGSGSVTLANNDGVGTFTATNQPYFHYGQIISPYEISAARGWQFQITGSVSTFSFIVYVSAPVVDEGAPLLDKVWDGDTSTDWLMGSNWQGGVAPDSASTVSIPSDSLLPSHVYPVLTADAFLTNLRVGFGSSLGLAGFTATAYGNVDAVGTVSGGTLKVAGSNVVIGGNLSAMQVTGSAKLQRSTKASGAVSVTGSLNVKDQAMTISIP
ncbi:MAG TPA: hypothetical protein VGO40_09500 [Longimicrobium sp.]|jgi:hypothetical protein|nr:hypothetical protein [Longimicrobium sp.]